MKFVMVQFPDGTDISSLAIDTVVAVGTVPSGTVVMAGSMQNPPAPTLIPHTHTFDAPTSITGPATP